MPHQKENRLLFHMFDWEGSFELLDGIRPPETRHEPDRGGHVTHGHLSITMAASGSGAGENIPVRPAGGSPVGFVMDEDKLHLAHADFVSYHSHGAAPPAIQKDGHHVESGYDKEDYDSKFPAKAGHVRLDDHGGIAGFSTDRSRWSSVDKTWHEDRSFDRFHENMEHRLHRQLHEGKKYEEGQVRGGQMDPNELLVSQKGPTTPVKGVMLDITDPATLQAEDLELAKKALQEGQRKGVDLKFYAYDRSAGTDMARCCSAEQGIALLEQGLAHVQGKSYFAGMQPSQQAERSAPPPRPLQDEQTQKVESFLREQCGGNQNLHCIKHPKRGNLLVYSSGDNPAGDLDAAANVLHGVGCGQRSTGAKKDVTPSHFLKDGLHIGIAGGQIGTLLDQIDQAAPALGAPPLPPPLEPPPMAGGLESFKRRAPKDPETQAIEGQLKQRHPTIECSRHPSGSVLITSTGLNPQGELQALSQDLAGRGFTDQSGCAKIPKPSTSLRGQLHIGLRPDHAQTLAQGLDLLPHHPLGHRTMKHVDVENKGITAPPAPGGRAFVVNAANSSLHGSEGVAPIIQGLFNTTPEQAESGQKGNPNNGAFTTDLAQHSGKVGVGQAYTYAHPDALGRFAGAINVVSPDFTSPDLTSAGGPPLLGADRRPVTNHLEALTASYAAVFREGLRHGATEIDCPVLSGGVFNGKSQGSPGLYNQKELANMTANAVKAAELQVQQEIADGTHGPTAAMPVLHIRSPQKPGRPGPGLGDDIQHALNGLDLDAETKGMGQALADHKEHYCPKQKAPLPPPPAPELDPRKKKKGVAFEEAPLEPIGELNAAETKDLIALQTKIKPEAKRFQEVKVDGLTSVWVPSSVSPENLVALNVTAANHPDKLRDHLESIGIPKEKTLTYHYAEGKTPGQPARDGQGKRVIAGIEAGDKVNAIIPPSTFNDGHYVEAASIKQGNLQVAFGQSTDGPETANITRGVQGKIGRYDTIAIAQERGRERAEREPQRGMGAEEFEAGMPQPPGTDRQFPHKKPSAGRRHSAGATFEDEGRSDWGPPHQPRRHQTAQQWAPGAPQFRMGSAGSQAELDDLRARLQGGVAPTPQAGTRGETLARQQHQHRDGGMPDGRGHLPRPMTLPPAPRSTSALRGALDGGTQMHEGAAGRKFSHGVQHSRSKGTHQGLPGHL